MSKILLAAACAAAFLLPSTAGAMWLDCELTVDPECVAPGDVVEIEVCVENLTDDDMTVEGTLEVHAHHGDHYELAAKTATIAPGVTCLTLPMAVPVGTDEDSYVLGLWVWEEWEHMTHCATWLEVSDDCL